jgi:hypothetical protein
MIVRKQESNRTIAAFDHSDRLLAIGRRQDFETEVAQQITDEPAHLRLVLDDQNGPRALVRIPQVRYGSLHLGPSIHGR